MMNKHSTCNTSHANPPTVPTLLTCQSEIISYFVLLEILEKIWSQELSLLGIGLRM